MHAGEESLCTCSMKMIIQLGGSVEVALAQSTLKRSQSGVDVHMTLQLAQSVEFLQLKQVNNR